MLLLWLTLHLGRVSRARASTCCRSHKYVPKEYTTTSFRNPTDPAAPAPPALVPIPRRIKYERQQRGAKPTPTRRASSPQCASSVEQVFREAYINLKLSKKLHEHRCVWAQCDFDGGDVASRSHEEHVAAYKEVCVCVYVHVINNVFKTVISNVIQTFAFAGESAAPGSAGA